jgi:DNA-binding PadR family transcriptional regulator
LAPITPLTYEILLTLADEPRHGYGIIKEIEARSGAASAPSTGALYLALQRMQGSGLIEEVEPDDSSEDARRRYYRLSAKGREHAEEESLRLARLVASARDKRLLTGEAS